MAMSKARTGRSKLEVMHPDAAGIDVGGLALPLKNVVHSW
jgi:hypothetical protein